MADDCEGRAGQTNIDGIQRLRTPFVRAAEGKGRFLEVWNLYPWRSEVELLFFMQEWQKGCPSSLRFESFHCGCSCVSRMW